VGWNGEGWRGGFTPCPSYLYPRPPSFSHAKITLNSQPPNKLHQNGPKVKAPFPAYAERTSTTRRLTSVWLCHATETHLWPIDKFFAYCYPYDLHSPLMTNSAKVKRKFPRAHSVRLTSYLIHIRRGTNRGSNLGWGYSFKEAWADAARKLS